MNRAMSHPLRVLLLALLTLLAGCFPVLYTDAPLGELSQLEAGDWNGLWLVDLDHSKSGKLVRYQLGVPGINGFAVTGNWRECEMSQAGPWEDVGSAKMHRYDGWYFPETKGCQVTGEPCEYTAIFQRDGAVLTMHFADEVRIRRLLDEGEVPGRIELLPSDGGQRQRVVLNPLTDAHYKELFNPLTGAFPIGYVVGVRLLAELDPCSKQSK